MTIKETNFTLDLTREGKHPVVKFRLNDNKVQKITFRLTNNGREVDLEREMGDQFKPVFECIFRDKTFKRDENQNNWQIKRDVTGKYPLYTFTYYLTDEVINKSGIACYYFALETPEGLRISTPTLKMVIDCDFKEDGKPSENYISEFEKLKKEADRYRQTVEDLDQTLREVLEGGASITEVIRARENKSGVIFKDLKDRLDDSDYKNRNVENELKKSRKGLDGKEYGDVSERLKADEKYYLSKKDFVSIREFENLKFVVSEGYDWTNAIKAAVEKAEITKRKVVLHADENIFVSDTIQLYPTTKIEGQGKNRSIIRFRGGKKIFDLSNELPKIGVELSNFGIYGDKSSGQIAIDAKYFVNGSSLRDISIENVDTAIRLTKSWYSSFDSIFIRGCNLYGLELNSSSSSEQINAINFKGLFIQSCLNSVMLNGRSVSAAVSFDSCTFELSKKTSVISNGFSPLKFTNCYFEGNYQDGSTVDTLTWDTPIDLKINGTTTRNLVSIDSCYFARKSDFIESTQKTSIFLGDNIKAELSNVQFVSNQQNYIDANVFTTDKASIPIINNISQDGYAKKMYVGIQRTDVLSSDLEVNLKFTSTFSLQSGITRRGSYTLRIIPKTSATLNTAPVFKAYDGFSGSQIGLEITLPKQIESGNPLDFNIGFINADIVRFLELRQTIGADVDVNCKAFILHKYPQLD